MPAPNDKYSFIELAAMLPGGGMKRHRWVESEDHKAITAWRNEFGNRDVYASVCRFDRPDRGSNYVCDFFLDLDGDNLAEVREQALKACLLLNERLGIAFGSLDIFFSGAKGFHLLVPSEVFGEPDHQHALVVWRALAGRLAKEGVQNIDLGIYQASRILRLPNSINSKSGRHKIGIEFQELRDFGIDYVLDLARSPREYDSLAVPEFSPRASAWLRDAVEWSRKRKERRGVNSGTREGFRRGWRIPPCIRAIEAAPLLPDCIRHQSYLALAQYWAWLGAHPLEIEERIRRVDDRHPIQDTACIERMVKYGTQHPGFRGCQDAAFQRYCRAEECFLARKRRGVTDGVVEQERRGDEVDHG